MSHVFQRETEHEFPRAVRWECIRVVDSTGTFVMQGDAARRPVSVQLAVVRMPDTRR